MTRSGWDLVNGFAFAMMLAERLAKSERASAMLRASAGRAVGGSYDNGLYRAICDWLVAIRACQRFGACAIVPDGGVHRAQNTRFRLMLLPGSGWSGCAVGKGSG